MLERFHPAVATWFRERFGAPTEAQARGWAEIGSGLSTLIMAPTGSGKTLAAFLAGLDALVRRAAAGALDDVTRIVYVSPLKALGADVERNLEAPLRGIEATAMRLGTLVPPIRTALRTGDTSQTDRARIVRRPPHVLITTPESLYLLLTSDKGRMVLAGVETLIVDEIHALVGNKRGAHLALSLERLNALTGRKVTRIGLSATVQAVDEVAHFLVGSDEVLGAPVARPCRVVDAGRKQPLDVLVEVPREPLSAVASREAWKDVHERLGALIGEHKTTLIFVPSRRMCERVAHDLEALLGKGIVAAHHGALAKRTRLSVEKKLQSGQLRAVVATASLELGIDIGDVELVCQLGSPRSIAVMRQRIGRAHHAVGGTPKGRIFAMTRDELVECAAAARAMVRGQIDRHVDRPAPLDVLAQQLVAACATGARDAA
ncbi:MAG TPA: DEAD/DEAH box helicase, partial [Ideonella sp.]|nr:DEAD/DEAH box helicase [Ideonella sp.]